MTAFKKIPDKWDVSWQCYTSFQDPSLFVKCININEENFTPLASAPAMLLSSIPPSFSVHFSFSSLFLSLFYSFSSLANSGNGSCVVNKQSSRSEGGESKARKTETENGTKRERLISYLEFRKMQWSKKAQYLLAVQRDLYKTNMMWSGIEALSLRAEVDDDRCVEESCCTLIFFPHWKCVVCFRFPLLASPSCVLFLLILIRKWTAE